MVDSPGWEWFKKVAEAQVTNRINDLTFKPTKGLDELIEKDYALGEVAGIKTIMEIPLLVLAQTQEEIKAELEKLEGEEDGSGSDAEPDYPIG